MLYKPRSRHYYNRWLSANSFLSNDKRGSKYVCLTPWDGRIFYKDWFEHAIDMPFEDITIKVPSDYDSYLRLLYGDYMQMPPVEHRISDHKHYYVNLYERKTIEDIKTSL